MIKIIALCLKVRFSYMGGGPQAHAARLSPFSVLVITLSVPWSSWMAYLLFSMCWMKKLISEKQNPEIKMEPRYISRFSVINTLTKAVYGRKSLFGLTGPSWQGCMTASMRGAGGRRLRNHTLSCKHQSRERLTGSRTRLHYLKVHHQWHPFPARLHHINSPKQLQQTGIQVFKYLSLWGHCPFKAPHWGCISVGRRLA